MSHKSPGTTKYEPITVERGVTHDMEFERWANKVSNLSAVAGEQVSLRDFRKDVQLELYNEAGQLVMAYKIFRRCIAEDHVASVVPVNFEIP